LHIAPLVIENMGKTEQKARAQIVRVGGDDDDRRLDNFLLSRLRGVPRSRIYRMIRGGEVRVNKGRCKPDRRLIEGDEVRIPPVRTSPTRAPKAGIPGDAAWIEDRILYEDRDLLILNKPSGLAVHGGSGISAGAIELLRAARSSSTDLELVHRLDRDTSGCLLISKRRPALRYLHGLFREGEVQKRYTALLLGHWKGGSRTIDLDIPDITSRIHRHDNFAEKIILYLKLPNLQHQPDRQTGTTTAARQQRPPLGNMKPV